MRWLVLGATAAIGCGGAETPPPESPPPPQRPLTAADLRAGASGGPSVIAPSRLEPFRIAGDKTIHPDDLRVSRRASFKFCVDETGQIAGVKVLQTSGDESYDAKIIANMQHWAYRPVVVDGKPTPVCSAVTFIYSRR